MKTHPTNSASRTKWEDSTYTQNISSTCPVWIWNYGGPSYKPAYIEWIMLLHYWNNFRDGCATTTRTVKMGKMNTRIAVSVKTNIIVRKKKTIEAFTSLIMWAGSQNDRWRVPWAKFAPSGIKRSNSKWVPTRRGESARIITRHKMSDCRKVKLSFRELITREVSEHEILKVEPSCRLEFLLLKIDFCSDLFQGKNQI